jgi:autotransporter-associated beta strand protein
LEVRTLLNATIALNGYPSWQEQGPGPIDQNSGAVQTIAVAQTPAGPEVYLGTANGGVWKTAATLNINDPTTFKWVPLTDQQPSLSVASMAVDPEDPTGNTLWVGTGGVSSWSRLGISAGLLETTNGGQTWTQLAAGQFSGFPIRALALTDFNDPTTGHEDIVLVANSTVFFSNDGGNTFAATELSGAAGVDVASDPNTPGRVYAGIAGVGVFQSDQGGAPNSWFQIDTPQTAMTQAQDIRLAVGTNSQMNPSVTDLYVAVSLSVSTTLQNAVTTTGQQTVVTSTPIPTSFLNSFLIVNNGNIGQQNKEFIQVQGLNGNNLTATFTNTHAAGEPLQSIVTNLTGVYQAVIPTQQGQPTWKTLPSVPNNQSSFTYPYFGMTVDPQNANILYLSGYNGASQLRGDASQGTWQLWNGGNADNRAIAFDGSDMLLAGDQGIFGIDPKNLVLLTPVNQNLPAQSYSASPVVPLGADVTIAAGDQPQVSDGLRNTELFRVAYDPTNGRILGGSQDEGSGIQVTSGNQVWIQLPNGGGDGGWVATDGLGDHYYFDNGQLRLNGNAPALKLNGVSLSLPNGDFPNFPIAVNQNPGSDPATNSQLPPGSQFLLGGFNNSVYESSDYGQTVQQVLSGMTGNAFYIAYGKNGGSTTPAYVGTTSGELYVRGTTPGFQKITTLPSNITSILEVVVDPLDYRTAYVLATDSLGNFDVLKTTDAGQSPWTDLTNDLNTQASFNGTVNLKTLELWDPSPQQPGQGILLAGGLGGLYRLLSYPTGLHWSTYNAGAFPGTSLPSAILVTDLHYIPQRDLLVAGTFGRGAWVVPNVTATVTQPEALEITTDNNANTIRLVLDAQNPQLLDVFVNQVLSMQVVQGKVPHIDISFGSGNDQLIVDESNGFITTPTQNPWPNYISLVGGSGQDTLTLDDSQDPNSNLVSIGPSSIDVNPQPGLPDYIAYSNINIMTIDSGVSGSDTVNVNRPETALTTINLGPAFTTVNVLQTSGTNSTLNIVGNVSQGSDAINIGQGNVQGILGTVNIESPPSFNDITINDAADLSPQLWTLGTLGPNPDDSEKSGETWGAIINGSIGQINYEYADTSSLTLMTGFAAGTVVRVLATNDVNLACQTNIVSRLLTEVDVGDSNLSVDVQGIASTLNLENPGGVDTIVVDDSADGTARKTTLSTLNSNPADSQQGSIDQWGQISGLAPGNINYEYADTGNLTIDGSGGGGTFKVTDIPLNPSLTLIGTGGTNTLDAPNVANAWTINAAQGGVLDSKITFASIQDLVGGIAGDTFTLSSVPAVSMNFVLNATSSLITPAGTQILTGTIANLTGVLTVGGAGNTTIQGVISGPGALMKQDLGTLSLLAANSYSGNTTIGEGTVIIRSNGALGAAGTSTTVDAGATLMISGSINYSTPEVLFLNGAGLSGSGALESRGGAVSNTFAGPILLQSASTIDTFNTPLILTGTVNNGGFDLTIAGAGNTNAQGVVSGTGGLIKQGSGTLTLSHANNYTGNTTVSAGILTITHDSALGAAGSSTTVAAGASLALSGGFTYSTTENLFLSGALALLNLGGANTFDGPIALQSASTVNTLADSLILGGPINISGAFALTVTGKGNTTLQGAVSGAGGLTKNGSGTLTLPVSNSYAGNTSLLFGIIVVSSNAALGAANTTTTVNVGATLALTGGFSYTTPETVNLNGAGFNGAGALENLSGTNSFAGPMDLQSSSTIKTAAGNLTLMGPIDTAGFTLTVIGAGNTAIPAVISGSGGLSMQGTGALTLSATNSYSAINISSGTVYVEADGALGGSAVVSTGGTLIFAGLTYTLPTSLTLNGGVVESVDILSAADSFAGSINLLTPSTIAATPGTTFTFKGPIATGFSMLTVFGPGSVVLNGVISGAGGLNQLPGTLTLSANNTYTGATTAGGILIVNGVQTASPVTVNAGGTLAGIGSVGAVVVKNGGTVEPGPLNGGGNSSLTAASADFSQGGELLVRIPNRGTPGVDYDQFIVTGAVTLGGASTLVFDVSGLTKRGKVSGIVTFGSVSGTFTNVSVSPVNNPLNLKAKLKYHANRLDVTLS